MSDYLKRLNAAHLDAIPILIDFAKLMTENQDMEIRQLARKALRDWDKARVPNK